MRALLVVGAVAASAFVDVGLTGLQLGPPKADAIIGRPATPVSVAGVARRTVRRTTAVAVGATAAAATVARVAVLPAGCVAAGGVYRCGAVSYRAVYDGPNVVYIQM